MLRPDALLRGRLGVEVVVFVAFRNRDSFNSLHILPLVVHHDAAEASDYAPQRDKQSGRPRWTFVAVVVPHVEAQDYLKEGVPDVHPDDKVHLPGFRWRRMHTSGRRVGYLLNWYGNRRVLGVYILRRSIGRKFVRTLETVPPAVDAGQASNTSLPPLHSTKSPPSPPVQVAKSPRSEAKASDAEQGVENLRIHLDPFPSRRIDVVAGRFTHCRRSIAEEQEEHAAPGDNVETIDGDEESGGGKVPFPERFQSYGGSSCPGNLWGWDIAIGILGMLEHGR